MPCPITLRDQVIINLAFARTKRAEAAAWPVVSVNLLATWDGVIATQQAQLATLNSMIQCEKDRAA